jgi:hypothetical protein
MVTSLHTLGGYPPTTYQLVHFRISFARLVKTLIIIIALYNSDTPSSHHSRTMSQRDEHHFITGIQELYNHHQYFLWYYAHTIDCGSNLLRRHQMVTINMILYDHRHHLALAIIHHVNRVRNIS